MTEKMNELRPCAIALVLFGIELASCAPRKTVDKGILGKWYWINKSGTSTFTLSLETSGDSLFGNYCSIVDKGNRIDCEPGEYNISGAGSDREVEVKFNSFFDATDGKAFLKLEDDTSLRWEIIKYPSGGNCYAPKKVTLVRHKRW